jgi:hypothetical protein
MMEEVIRRLYEINSSDSQLFKKRHQEQIKSLIIDVCCDERLLLTVFTHVKGKIDIDDDIILAIFKSKNRNSVYHFLKKFDVQISENLLENEVVWDNIDILLNMSKYSPLNFKIVSYAVRNSKFKVLKNLPSTFKDFERLFVVFQRPGKTREENVSKSISAIILISKYKKFQEFVLKRYDALDNKLFATGVKTIIEREMDISLKPFIELNEMIMSNRKDNTGLISKEVIKDIYTKYICKKK